MADYMDGLSSKAAFEEAATKGLMVVLPDEFSLQVDIDNQENFVLFNNRLDYLKNWYDLKYKKTPSKKGGEHLHITVCLDKVINPLERIFLQLYLGSDSTREFLSFQRIKNKDPNPTLFFEVKSLDK